MRRGGVVPEGEGSTVRTRADRDPRPKVPGWHHNRGNLYLKNKVVVIIMFFELCFQSFSYHLTLKPKSLPLQHKAREREREPVVKSSCKII